MEGWAQTLKVVLIMLVQIETSWGTKTFCSLPHGGDGVTMTSCLRSIYSIFLSLFSFELCFNILIPISFQKVTLTIKNKVETIRKQPGSWESFMHYSDFLSKCKVLKVLTIKQKTKLKPILFWLDMSATEEYIPWNVYPPLFIMHSK